MMIPSNWEALSLKYCWNRPSSRCSSAGYRLHRLACAQSRRQCLAAAISPSYMESSEGGSRNQRVRTTVHDEIMLRRKTRAGFPSGGVAETSLHRFQCEPTVTKLERRRDSYFNLSCDRWRRFFWRTSHADTKMQPVIILFCFLCFSLF